MHRYAPHGRRIKTKERAMGEIKGSAERLSFKEVFAQSIKDAGAGRLAMAMSMVRHPSHRHIEIMARRAPGSDPIGKKVFEAWMGGGLPWMGAAVWGLPAALEKEMINKARCGALFSHGTTEAENDRAYIEHLGPLGCRVSGTEWKSSAFEESERYPIKVTVGLHELSIERGDNRMMEGSERPSYWPEPLPMVKRVWRTEDPPSLAPDFGAVAEIMAWQMRASVAEAIMEETDATREQLGDILGGVMRLSNKAARHFARQEHPMFGASKLGAEEREESMLAMDVARGAFELGAIQRAAKRAPPGRGEGPRL